MVTLSVVLPNYNYARYLDQRITSLLNQTFTDFELIIVDDASTDNSREVIQKYAGDPRVRLKFYEKNSGQVYQRWNDGARLAKGKYLLFAGADDYCDEHLFERLVAAMDQAPDIGFALCNSRFVDENGRPTGIHRDPKALPKWGKDFVEGPDFWMPELDTGVAIANSGAMIMKRELFESYGGFSLKYRLIADLVMYMAIADKWKVAYVAEPMNFFRHHPNTVREAIAKDSLRRLQDFSRAFFEFSRYDRLRGEDRNQKTKWLAEIFLRAAASCRSPRAVGACLAGLSFCVRYNPKFPFVLAQSGLKVVSRVTFGK